MTLFLGTGPGITTGRWIPVNVAQTIKKSASGYYVNWGATSGGVIGLTYAANSSSNRLLVMCSLTVGLDFGGRIGANLFLDGSRVDALAADTSGNITRRTTGEHAGSSYNISNLAFNYVNTSPSTSNADYSVRLGQGDNGNRYVYVNRPHNEPDQSYQMRGTSSITIVEFQYS